MLSSYANPIKQLKLNIWLQLYEELINAKNI